MPTERVARCRHFGTCLTRDTAAAGLCMYVCLCVRVVDLGRCCRRTCLAKEGTGCVHIGSHGQVHSLDTCVCNAFGRFRRRNWHTTRCESCVELELHSGDILLFKGNPNDDVAHGALDTIAGSGPAGMPGWAQGCRVSLQYRVRTAL